MSLTQFSEPLWAELAQSHFSGEAKMKASDSTLQSVLLFAVMFIASGATVEVRAQASDEDQLDALIEEVIVTAQRRETNLQTTAIAASVLSGEALAEKGVDDLAMIQYAVPSVHISDFGSANVFNIRGIGRSKVDIEIPSGVVIYADGIPTIAGYFQNEPYYDIGSIEVLRGPQGTFVGKSASGGAIFMNTRDPEIGVNGGNVEFGAGSDSMYEVRGAYNASSSDTFAFRAAFNYYNRDTYYDVYGPYTGDPGSRDLRSGRFGFLWQPNEKLSVKAKLNLAALDFGGNITGNTIGQPLFYIHQDAPFRYFDKTQRFTLDIDYLMDSGVKFSSLTGYQHVETENNLDLNGADQSTRYWFLSAGEIDLWSQEFNWVSPEDQPLRWVFGIFLQNQKGELLPVDRGGFTFWGGDPFLIGQLPLDYPWLGSPWIKDEDDWALFGHIVYDVREDLEFEVGVRYSDYEFYQVTDYVYGFGDAFPVLPFDGVEGPDRQAKAEDSTDWKLALNWEKDNRNFLYGVISRGHTTGSINIFPPWDPYDEIVVLNYEAGWKAAWQDGRVTTQLALYYENIEGYQAAFTDLDIPNSAGQVQNADSDSTIYGIEFTGQANLDAVQLDWGISFNESELGDFNNVVHPLTLETVDLTGASFPYAPDFSFNLGLQRVFQLSNGSTLTPRLDYGYVGDAKAELFPEPEFDLEARGLVNVNIRWDQGDGPWYATFWATNLNDKEYVAAIQNVGSLYYAGPPRQWGVRFGRDF
jgi:iron complex outermembrane receptor protein